MNQILSYFELWKKRATEDPDLIKELDEIVPGDIAKQNYYSEKNTIADEPETAQIEASAGLKKSKHSEQYPTGSEKNGTVEPYFEPSKGRKNQDISHFTGLTSFHNNDANAENNIVVSQKGLYDSSQISEIYERFYKSLEFGTAGLRGIIGAGTNRMNIYTVRQATQGLADYLNSKFESPSVAISFDSRIKSDLFAKEAARVLAANNIVVHIAQELNPVPYLSFSVRELRCSAGIMITASHNHFTYNGYKCYGPDGCQMTTAAADAVYEYIKKIDIFDGVKICDFQTALNIGKINYISDEITKKYIEKVKEQALNPSVCERANLKVVYTPLNGSGNKLVRKILNEQKITNISVVKEQEQPDGNFPTCPYPNPEADEALAMAIKLAEKENADLVIATDPDSDRVGIACLDCEKDGPIGFDKSAEDIDLVVTAATNSGSVGASGLNCAKNRQANLGNNEGSTVLTVPAANSGSTGVTGLNGEKGGQSSTEEDAFLFDDFGAVASAGNNSENLGNISNAEMGYTAIGNQYGHPLNWQAQSVITSTNLEKITENDVADSDIVGSSSGCTAKRACDAEQNKPQYRKMTGNEVGVMLTEYILARRKEKSTLNADSLVIKTIVTSDLVEKIAQKYGCKVKNVLTGFKYIGEQIAELEKNGKEKNFVFGFEESYGYLSGTYVRDKDAVVTAMLICEMASYFKLQGKTLANFIDEIYKEYGYYKNTTVSRKLDGADGALKIKNIMEKLRMSEPNTIAGLNVVAIADYLNSVEKNCTTNSKKTLDLPKSNVLAYYLENNNKVIVRPSGTEPTIKIYVTSVGENLADADKIGKKIIENTLQILGV